ncbi:MAG TPA: PEGA domain-containing protein, partial [Chloroflexota bacterium]
MLALDRFIPLRGARRRALAGASNRPARHRRSPTRPVERVRTLLPALCGIGVAAVAGWLLAGGSLPSARTLFGQLEPAAVETSAGGAPVHLDSTPSGASVRIDGTSHGRTPLDTWLSPGQHSLTLQHPDALDDDQPLQVADSGASLDIALWRRRPDVLPLRPVYPGATLVDARFLDDGQVALLVDTPARSGATGTNRELWRSDPATAQLTRVSLPGNGPKSIVVLAPDEEQVAYITPGSASNLSASLWPVNGNTPTRPQGETHAESVWLAPLDGRQPPRRIFELPSVSGPGAANDLERIVDLVWTPDGSQLIAITRQAGTPARSRVFVVNVTATGGDGDSPPDAAHELVLLPAEIVPGSAVPDQSGRWLALVAHAASAPAGHDVLNLCILELQSGGAFRDLADLGTAAIPLSAAPFAWLPATDSTPDRLVFVGPAPTAASGGGGLFGISGIFSALRPSAPPSGLFMANLEASGLQDAQPRRLGTAINTFGPVWRSESALLGFARQDDGTLALRSIDPTSGAVRDLGVRLPAATAQGAGVAARWDARHGNALLLAH